MRRIYKIVLGLGCLGATVGCSSDSTSSGSNPPTGGGGASGVAGGASGVAGGASGGATGGTTTVTTGGQAAAGGASGGATTAGGGGASGGAAGGAGAGGQGAIGGAGGSAAGAGGAAPVTKSTGCGKPAQAALVPEMYIRLPVPSVAKTNKGAVRVYELRLPKSYDMNRPYPVVFEDHGCDGSIPFHIEKATGPDSIVVALRAADNQDNNYMGGCFQAGEPGPGLNEIPYFDAVVADFEASLCVDTGKLFMEGYSSGSWLTNMLGCMRSNVIRGQGNATGGLPPNIPMNMCQGPIAAMMAHDDTDTDNTIQMGMVARDRIKAINGCSDQTVPYEWDVNPATPSTCVEYVGCKPGYPLVWCPTHGKGHSDQVPISTVGFWKFWSALPPRP
jgi:polyhydroxybutyrate depolymerase